MRGFRDSAGRGDFLERVDPLPVCAERVHQMHCCGVYVLCVLDAGMCGIGRAPGDVDEVVVVVGEKKSGGKFLVGVFAWLGLGTVQGWDVRSGHL